MLVWREKRDVTSYIILGAIVLTNTESKTKKKRRKFKKKCSAINYTNLDKNFVHEIFGKSLWTERVRVKFALRTWLQNCMSLIQFIICS